MNKYLLKIMAGFLVISCLSSLMLFDLGKVVNIENQSLRRVRAVWTTVKIIPVIHLTKEDFGRIKPLLEAEYNTAKSSGKSFIVLDEIVGPPIKLLKETLVQMGILPPLQGISMLEVMERILRNDEMQEFLKSWFDSTVKEMNLEEVYKAFQRGEIPPEIVLDENDDFTGFSRAYYEWLAKHRVKVVPEKMDYEAWRKDKLYNLLHLRSIAKMFEGDKEEYIRLKNESITFEKETVEIRDVNLLGQLQELSGEDMVIFTLRGAIHKLPEGRQGDVIIKMNSNDVIYGPAEEIIARELREEEIKPEEKEILLLREVVFRILEYKLYSEPISMRDGVKLRSISRGVADRWRKEEVEELLAHFKISEASGGEYFINWLEINGTEEEKSILGI